MQNNYKRRKALLPLYSNECPHTLKLQFFLQQATVEVRSIGATLLYCCTASACSADGVAFGLELDEFCDLIGPEDMERMSAGIRTEADSKSAVTEGYGSKKKPRG